MCEPGFIIILLFERSGVPWSARKVYVCVWAAPDPGKPQIEIIAQSALYFLRSNGVVKPKRSINN